ncbi:uncharacterized protein LOC121373003 [Gigantopelta aegis]|uniref:uncharacterized protein LOC121373003 n=1 Tax=Gigantopelta aegis TaxID=1735272 RepID=UPI001B88D1F5|nr:uncharacterized protein LOC121373003 [Gigantopelta aegis]
MVVVLEVDMVITVIMMPMVVIIVVIVCGDDGCGVRDGHGNNGDNDVVVEVAENVIVVVVMLVFSIFRFFMVGKVDKVCAALSDHLQTYTALHVYLYQFILIFILPVTLVLVCNVLVLVRIYRVRNMRNTDDSSLPRARNVVNSRHKTTLMLLTISFIYVITLLPSLVVSIVAYATIATTTLRDAGLLLVRVSPYKDVCELVSDLNYGCNFFIYILSGKLFRFELKKMFTWDRSTGITTTKVRDDIVPL